MIRRPPRSTPLYSSAASDVYKRQVLHIDTLSTQIRHPFHCPGPTPNDSALRRSESQHRLRERGNTWATQLGRQGHQRLAEAANTVAGPEITVAQELFPS